MRSPARRVPLITVMLPVFVIAAAGCDLVTADLKHTETAEWRKTYELQPGGRVEIDNVNGKIDVERSAGNAVEVVAQKSARGATPEAARQALERLEIQDTASPSGIRIETKVPRTGFLHGGGGQVAYTVRVPAGADVRFKTVNGGIELRDLEGRVRAETTNGGIRARNISGAVDASTTNGGVEVDLTALDAEGASLSCTNGGIRLRLPADARASISASITNGGIDTGGLQLETTESSRRRLEARLNGGGPPVRLSGTNGGIRIDGR